MEFQKRGAAHIHVYLNGEVKSSEVAAAWYRIVGSGDERHLRAGTRVESIRNHNAATAYATKYAQKIEQKSVPLSYQKVGRFWGLFGGVKVEAEAVIEGFQERDGERATSPVDELARQLVRFVRRAVHSSRKSWATKRARRDNGKCSWVGWDVGWTVRDYLERVGHLVREGPPDPRIRRGFVTSIELPAT